MTGYAPFTLLTTGKFLEAFMSVYTGLLGSWLYLLLFGAALILIYLKTENFGTTTIIGLLILGPLYPVLPEGVHTLIFVLAALGVTSILYRVFH